MYMRKLPKSKNNELYLKLIYNCRLRSNVSFISLNAKFSETICFFTILICFGNDFSFISLSASSRDFVLEKYRRILLYESLCSFKLFKVNL